MASSILTRSFLAILLLTAAVPAQRKVLIADPLGGKGSYSWSLKDTVNAAKDGDAVLARRGSYVHGTYQQVLVDNKSVTIFADPQEPGTAPVYAPVVWIRNIPAWKRVTIQGLTFSNLEIRDCKGSVVLENCKQVDPGSSTLFTVKVTNSAAVTFANCDFLSEQGGAMLLEESKVYAVDSTFRAQPPGTHGMELSKSTGKRSSMLLASNCSFAGGDGQSGFPLGSICYRPGVPGGDGLRSAYGSVSLFNCSTIAGRGAAANGPCPAYPGGKAVNQLGGTVNRTRQPARSLRTNTAVREGQKLELEVDGIKGDWVWLFYQLDHKPWFLPSCGGALVPDLYNFGPLLLGQIGSSPLKLSVIVQPLIKQDEFAGLMVQALAAQPGKCILTNPRTIVLLNRRF